MRLASSPDADPGAAEEEVRAASAIDLPAFLEDVALVADVDGWAGDADKITLMTLHSAKGLEFDNVFVTGLEEGLLPHRNCRDDESREEERRLFYVGITRAKKRAWVTHAATRFIHGSADFSKPSLFLSELPGGALVEEDYGDSLSLSFGSGYSGGKRAWEDADDDFADDFSDVAFSDDNASAAPDGDFFELDGDFDPGFESGDETLHGEGEVKKKPTWPKREWPKAKPKEKPAYISRFKPGDLVRHPMFGSGKVLTTDRGKIMVQFFSSGTRLLNEDLAQLSKE